MSTFPGEAQTAAGADRARTRLAWCPYKPDKVWCGVDIGSTKLKVLLLAEDRQVLWREAQPTPRISDGVGPCASADTVLVAIEAMILSAHAAAGLKCPLAAIAVGGVAEDGVPIDEAGRPLDVAIPWFDRRGEAVARAMASDPISTR